MIPGWQGAEEDNIKEYFWLLFKDHVNGAKGADEDRGVPLHKEQGGERDGVAADFTFVLSSLPCHYSWYSECQANNVLC